jgi:cytoskeletal protein CcmA (bactofilin family)
MFGSKHSKPQTQIDSLIGANATIGGDINFSGGLRVDGQVNGNVIATPGKPSTLVLSEHARINGEVSVTHLVSNGTINGSVSASEYLELQGKARVTGDIHYKTMQIQLGAIVEGRLIHGKPEALDKVVALKASSGE